MNLNNFTIKAQEAVQQAVQLVTKNNQQVIEPVHLLKAVIMTGEGKRSKPEYGTGSPNRILS